jgi:hypothetical protein
MPIVLPRTMIFSVITAVEQSQYIELFSRLAESSTATLMKPARQARCTKPDVPVDHAGCTNSTTIWPHQKVNASCPRFAMLSITTVSGLGQRFQEVTTAHSSMNHEL